jgi:hypothetical protein
VFKIIKLKEASKTAILCFAYGTALSKVRGKWMETVWIMWGMELVDMSGKSEDWLVYQSRGCFPANCQHKSAASLHKHLLKHQLHADFFLLSGMFKTNHRHCKLPASFSSDYIVCVWARNLQEPFGRYWIPFNCPIERLLLWTLNLLCKLFSLVYFKTWNYKYRLSCWILHFNKFLSFIPCILNIIIHIHQLIHTVYIK